MTDPATLEYIEKTTNAFIRPLKKIAQFEISGTDLAVTLALSQIEELAGTALVGEDIDQFDDANDDDGVITISPNTNNASSRLSTVLERALSANSDGICSAEDYRKVPQAVKRVLVNCLQDDDIDDDLLFADGNKEIDNASDDVTGSRIMMFYEDDDKPNKVNEKSTVETSPGVSKIAEKVTELSVTKSDKTSLLTKQQEYLRSFGMSVGFKETEVDKALCFVHEKTRPSDFLDLLNSLQNQEEADVSHENDSDDDVIILETETVDLVTDERVVVDETLKGKDKGKVSDKDKTDDTGISQQAQAQKTLPDGYKLRLLQDFFTEDENCSVDDLKKRNAERQKLLRENFESQQRNVGNQSNVQGQQGKKNKKSRNKAKKNKQQQQQQNVENKQKEGMHDKQFRLDTGDNEKVAGDDDQTCVLRVWSKDPGSTGSGVGQTAEDPFQTTPKRKGKNNQQQWPQHVSGNNNQQRQSSPVFHGGAQYEGPVGRGKKPTQIVTPVHTPASDQNMMVPQAQGGHCVEDLRYIVIDGSNVAMT